MKKKFFKMITAFALIMALSATLAIFVSATEADATSKPDTFTVNGAALTTYMADVDSDDAFTPDTEAIKDGYFAESEFRSAPYFDVQIDGINFLSE